MDDLLRRKWHDLLRVWETSSSLADQTFEELRLRYAEPGRFYHTLEHVQNVLETVERLASYACHPNAVCLAAWLHDVIYDSRASDNEERSAEYALRLCDSLSVSKGSLIAALIRTTKTHDASGDADAHVLIDADLAVLGADETVYRSYADKIRQEYSWVSESDYREGRDRILRNFLKRSKIYYFLHHLENTARHNLTAEIERLMIG